ncbi:3D domain-containing protein [Paenibacillus lautus]|uniref:3D domain-containing protein n=1 Tax=Paenibacillus lautus TaxID=1401 RepID=UPI003D2B93CD
MDKISERVSKCHLRLPALAILLAVLATGCGQNHDGKKEEVVESVPYAYNPLVENKLKEMYEDKIKAENQERKHKEKIKKARAEAVKAKAEQKKKELERKNKEEVERKSEGSWDNYILTHYVATCPGCSGFTKEEIDVRNTTEYRGYRVLSVDENRIPLGSIVEIKDGEKTYKAIAIDTGGAIKGNKLDLLVGSYKEAINLGKKTIKLRIVRRGWQDAKNKI